MRHMCRHARIAKSSPETHDDVGYCRVVIHDRLLTVTDVADYLQMSKDYVLNEIDHDYLEAIYLSTTWRIEPSALIDYIEMRKTMTSYLYTKGVRLVE